jgi:hypothetical protein
MAACHLPRKVFEALGVEERPVELSALVVAQLRERWVADDLLGASA